MVNLETFLILIMTSCITCFVNNVCVSPRFKYGESYHNRYGYQYGTENATCYNLDQMHVTPDLCSYRECTITFSGENGILKTNSFSRMENLEQVFLNDTYIRTVENKAFSGSPNIKLIHLERNQIAQIPRYIFSQLSSLEYLNLHDNRIGEIEDESLNGCTSLSYLDLSSNKLQNLSLTLFRHLVQLKTLNISNNFLDIIHTGFCESSLETLILDHNQISSMDNLWLCYNLKTLSLAYNNLKTIDYPFPPILEHLNMSANNITLIEKNTFHFLRNLLVLDISKNNLQNLPFELFDHLKNLQCLDLSFNHFTTLDEGVFSGLINLRTLNLSGINLSYLETRIFYSTRAISMIDISGNRITNFDLKLLSRFCRELRSLTIDGNNFTCPVLAEILLQAEQEHYIIQISPGHSHGRKNINGIACFDGQESSNDKTPKSIMEYPKTSPTFKEPLEDFNELVKMQKNLLRNISIDNSVTGQGISRKINSTNELLRKLIETNEELVGIQKNNLNISNKMDNTNLLLRKLIESKEELAEVQKNKLNNSMKMDSTKELLQNLLELNKKLVEIHENRQINDSDTIKNTMKILFKNFMPGEDIIRKIDSSDKLIQKLVEAIESNKDSQEDHVHLTSKLFTTEIRTNQAAFSAENSDIKNIISSLNDLKILLVICTFIMITCCVVKLLRKLRTKFSLNKYVMESQELPFIERQNTQSI